MRSSRGRRVPLCIACLVDAALVGQIRSSVPTTTAARYDLSVFQAHPRIYESVQLLGVYGGRDQLQALSRLRPDVAFNLAFSALPLEPSFAACLDVAGIPYTGSGPLGIALANDKIRARRLLASASIPIPKWTEVWPGRPFAERIAPPLIVKPATLASSAGIYADSVVDDWRHVPRLAARIWRRYGPPAMCEEFIVGRELRVGMIEIGRRRHKMVGVSEWMFGSALPGQGFNTEAIRNNPRVRLAQKVTSVTGRLSRRVFHEIETIAGRSMNLLDVRGYATVDIRLDRDGRPFVIEVNANPGLTSGGFVWSRPSFDHTISAIVRAALRRARES